MVPDIDILKIEILKCPGDTILVSPGQNGFYRKNMSFVVFKRQVYFPSFMLESLDKLLWYRILLFFQNMKKLKKVSPGQKTIF